MKNCNIPEAAIEELLEPGRIACRKAFRGNALPFRFFSRAFSRTFS